MLAYLSVSLIAADLNALRAGEYSASPGWVEDGVKGRAAASLPGGAGTRSRPSVPPSGSRETDSIPSGAGDSGRIVERVVAVVEDRAVLLSEIELEYRRYLLGLKKESLGAEEESKVRREILDVIIAELLMSVHAAKEGIEVNEDEIDAGVERAIEENKRGMGGEEAFSRQLEREGLTLPQLRSLYREKMRTRLLVERLINRDVRSDVQVTEDETRNYYEAHIGELPKRPPAVKLAHILLIPKASGLAGEEARARAEEIEKEIRAGRDFAEAAKEYSEGPSATYGGSLGYIRLEDLNNPEFEEAAKGLSVGEVSRPVLTEFGYHLIKLVDVDGDKVHVRHILIKVEAGEGDLEKIYRFAEEIRGEIIGGADFEGMAARYSDDHATRNEGGLIGEVPLENLPEFFRGIIENVGNGEIAPVIKEQKGFRIVKVLGRSPERTYTYQEARDELRRLIEQEKLRGKYDDYVDELKGIYYVEVKEEF